MPETCAMLESLVSMAVAPPRRSFEARYGCTSSSVIVIVDVTAVFGGRSTQAKTSAARST